MKNLFKVENTQYRKRNKQTAVSKNKEISVLSKNNKLISINKIINLSTSIRPSFFEINFKYTELFNQIESIFNIYLLSDNQNHLINNKNKSKKILKNSLDTLNLIKCNNFLNQKRSYNNKNKDSKNNVNISLNCELNLLNVKNSKEKKLQIFKIFYKCKVHCMKFILEWINKLLQKLKCKNKLRKIDGKIIEDCTIEFNLFFIELTLKDIFTNYEVSELYKKKIDINIDKSYRSYNKELINFIYNNKEKFKIVIDILNLSFKIIFNKYWKMKSSIFKETYNFRNKYLLDSYLRRLMKTNFINAIAIKNFTKIDIKEFLNTRIPKIVNVLGYRNI